MSEYSAIAPPEYLRLLKAAGLLGNYHLILAHDVATRPEAYEGLFGDDDFIIMDNSLIELGEPVTAKVMIKACKTIRPTCIVLPDRLNDMLGTIRDTVNKGNEWIDEGIDTLATNGFMCVPQGKNLFEFTSCVHNLHEWANETGAPLNYWSVPKIFGETNGSRRAAVDTINSIVPEAQIHLLGFSQSFKDDMVCARLENVIGIDSAVPVRMGINGQRLTLNTSEHSPRGSYFEDTMNATSIEPLVITNINYIRNIL